MKYIKEFHYYDDENLEEKPKETSEERVKRFIPKKIWNELPRYQKNLVINATESKFQDFLVYSDTFMELVPDFLEQWNKRLSAHHSIDQLIKSLKDVILWGMMKKNNCGYFKKFDL